MQTSPTTRQSAHPRIDSRSDGARVLVIAASTRAGSINRALARQIAERFVAAGDDAETVELGDHPLPLYSDDVERCSGVPAAAHELAGRIVDAEVLVIVSPEYNGTFTPLLKNTVDWVTRVRACPPSPTSRCCSPPQAPERAAAPTAWRWCGRGCRTSAYRSPTA